MRLLWALLLLATPAWANPEPADEVEPLVKAIKEGERAAFERHHPKVYLDLFTPDAVWVHGRRAQPEPYDVVFSRAQKTALLTLETARPPDRNNMLFFESQAAELAADPPTLELRIKRRFFGGSDLVAMRYTLRKVGDQYRVAAVRMWPLEEAVAMQSLKFDEAFWKAADERAAQVGTFVPEDIMENLRWARRFPEAHAVSVRMTEAPGATATQWMLRAQAALRIGQLDDARLAVKRAQALDPEIDPPMLLRGKPGKR